MDLLTQPLHTLALLWETSVRNPELRDTVEVVLQQRISANKLYSIEKLYRLSSQRTLSVFFIPTTTTYKLYGQNITLLNLELTTEQVKSLLLNLTQSPPLETHGLVKAKILNPIDDEKEDLQKLIIFNTNEILEIK